MPTIGALVAANVGEFAMAAGGIGAAGGAAAGTVDAGLIAGEVGFGAGAAGAGVGAAEIGSAGLLAGEFGELGVGAGVLGAETGGLFTGALTEGAMEGGAGIGLGGGASLGDQLSRLFSKGGSGKGLFQTGAGLYSLLQSNKLSKLATQPNRMGEQAVMRSMAAQGYQGSGNMMAALSQYGINGSLAASRAGMGPLQGEMSSLGLIASGIPQIWGGGGGG